MDTNSEPPRNDPPGPAGTGQDEAPSTEAHAPDANAPAATPTATGWVVPPTTAPPSSPTTNRTMLVVGWLRPQLASGSDDSSIRIKTVFFMIFVKCGYA